MNKHQVGYYKCSNCDFIQTENPYWLDEAYQSAITDLDVGLVSRNISFAGIIGRVIKNSLDPTKKFLDYAGGYGLFVRLMRDNGFDFYREDRYCENIFSQYHDISNVHDKRKFEIVTALEVFEHLKNPLEEIKKMLNYSDSIIFSTELQPKKEIKNSDDWWYFSPEIGQHISFYTEKTLKYIAEKLHLYFYTANNNLHLISKRKFANNPLLAGVIKDNISDTGRSSLLQSDYDLAKIVLKNVSKIKKNYRSYGDDEKKNIQKLMHDLAFAHTELGKTKTELETTHLWLDSIRKEVSSTKSQLASTKEELSSTESQLTLTKTELERLYSSREWRLAIMSQRIVKFLIPKGSSRRKIAVATLRITKTPLRLMRKIRGYLYISLKPKKNRKINLNSKKIVYIGHSYHSKTRSTVFLINYLKKFYEVKVVLDESWRGGSFPDLSFIDESYLGVIFFQSLPAKKVLKSIKNDNIVYFPMCDQSGRLGRDFWNDYRDLKIINFSRALHEKLKKWGFESMYIQYFPDVQKFIPGKKDEVFFWQRLTKININTVTKLFKKEKVKIHVHRAIDPDQQFVKPNEESEKKFNITYSDWFETRKEMWDIIKQKGIYVAPREYEGIGMSFLEAMAMGKAVIAVNNPTMNEYIEHGKTGYLFDLSEPEIIDLSKIEDVQRNTYEFMQKGYDKWKKESREVIDFIERE